MEVLHDCVQFILAEQIKDQIDLAQFGYPTIEELAEAFKVNRTTLYRTFKQAYGCGVKEYLDSVRMKHALSLHKSGVKLDAIYRICGYGSEEYFRRIFASYSK